MHGLLYCAPALAFALSLTGCKEKVPPLHAAAPREALMMRLELERKADTERLWTLYSKRMRTQVLAPMLKNIRKLSPEQCKKETGLDKKEVLGLSQLALMKKLMRRSMKKNRKEPAVKIIGVDSRGKGMALVRFTKGRYRCRQMMRLEGVGWKVDGLVACRGSRKKKQARGRR